MADSYLVCSPELATIYSPYLLIELDQEILQQETPTLVLQPIQHNLSNGFSHDTSFSVLENQQLSSFVCVQNDQYIGQFYERAAVQRKGGVVLHIDKSYLKLKQRAPDRQALFKALKNYPFKAEDSEGISLNNLAKATGISTTQILNILHTDPCFSIKVKKSLDICWIEKRVIDSLVSHLLPLVTEFPLSKNKAGDILQQINQFNEEILDAALYRLFKHNLNFGDLSEGIPEESLFEFDTGRFYNFLIDKMTKEKSGFVLEQFKEVFVQLAQMLLQESPQILDNINQELKIKNQKAAATNFVHGYQDLNLSFLIGRGYVDIKEEEVLIRFMNKLELPSEPKARAIKLSQLKAKWFDDELVGLLQDCFISKVECEKFIKANYDDSTIRSFFDFEHKIPVHVLKANK